MRTPTIAAIATVVLLAAGEVSHVRADDGIWHAYTPMARKTERVVYDSARQRMVVFGGRRSFPLNDIRALDLVGSAGFSRLDQPGDTLSFRGEPFFDSSGDRFIFLDQPPTVEVLTANGPFKLTTLTPSGDSPPPRQNYTKVFDSARNRVLVFGGVSGTSYLNDVWVLHFAPTLFWERIQPLGMPPTGRSASAAAYDSNRDRIVFYGGYGLTADPFASPQDLYDLWELSLGSIPQWNSLSPSGATPGRLWTPFYDAVNDRLLFFGSKYWLLEFNAGIEWTPLSFSFEDTSIPALDPIRNRIIMIGGGRTIGTTGYKYATRVRALDLTTLSTTDLLSHGDAPDDGFATAIVFDPVRDRFMMSGYTTLWTYRPVEQDLFRLEHEGTWLGGATCYDPYRDRIIAYGGDRLTALDLEEPSTAYEIPIAGVPRPYAWRSITYDVGRDRLIGYFGALGVWVMPFDAPAWSQISTTGETPPNKELTGVFDPVQDRYIVFGPGHGDGTWTLDLGGVPRWNSLVAPWAPSGPVSLGDNAVFDPVGNRLLTFGGSYFYPSNATYALDLAHPTGWSKMQFQGWPPTPRTDSRTAFDPIRNALIVYSGRVQNGYSSSIVGDLYSVFLGTPGHFPSVTGGEDLAWSPGEALRVEFNLENPYGFDQDVIFSLASTRAWPGFPMTGSTRIAASGTSGASFDVAVPDTATSGLNPVTLSAVFKQSAFRAECTRTLGDAATPTVPSLARLTIQNQLITLEWFGAGEVVEPVVERRVEEAEWQGFGAATHIAHGLYRFEDRTAVPGHVYNYRLRFLSGGVERHTTETTVHVPGAARLSLSLASNPSRSPLIRFTLPDAAPSSIDVFDSTGRRLGSRPVGAMGAGDHEVDLSELSLRPGLYLIRLSRPDRKVTIRAIVLS